jgi:hypothetical protein
MIETLNVENWKDFPSYSEQAIQLLEAGKVLFLPELKFSLLDNEISYLQPHLVSPKTKNISYDLNKDNMRGAICPEHQKPQLKMLMQRYAETTNYFIRKLLHAYHEKLEQGRTSFRPAQIEGRVSSYKKDDTRLHVDAFPSSPTRGKRILRIFTNINQENQSRIWRIGDYFENVVQDFLPLLKKPVWGTNILLQAFKITKTRRTLYDHYMLQLHNTMKYNTHYQKTASQIEFHFPPNSSWIVFTDQVSHAAMAGQHVLEQTFYLPFQAMMNESKAPIRILERYLQQNLLVG